MVRSTALEPRLCAFGRLVEYQRVRSEPLVAVHRRHHAPGGISNGIDGVGRSDVCHGVRLLTIEARRLSCVAFSLRLQSGDVQIQGDVQVTGGADHFCFDFFDDVPPPAISATAMAAIQESLESAVPAPDGRIPSASVFSASRK